MSSPRRPRIPNNLKETFDPRLKEALEVLAGFRGKAGKAAALKEDLLPYEHLIDANHQLVLREQEDITETIEVLDGTLTGIDIDLVDTRRRLDDAEQELTDTQLELEQARDAIVAADNRATEVRDDHDRLIAGFEGTLADAFEERDAILDNSRDRIAEAEQDLVDARDRLGLAERTLESQTPTLRSVEEAVDTFAQSVALLGTLHHDLEGRISDAGVYVDPESGEVRIAAVEAVEGRTNEAEIRLDAAEASINLRATTAYVDGQIASAVIDPTQIPVFDDLMAQINQAEIDINGLEATIGLKADTATVEGYEVRLSEAEVRVDGLEGEIALKASQTEFEEAQTRLTTAEQTLSTIDGASISQSVTDVRLHGERIDAAEIQTLEDLMNFYEGREAVRRELAFVTDDIHARVSEEGEALARANRALGVQIDEANALIVEERVARANGEEALAGSVNSLQADIGEAFSAIEEERIVRVREDEALASVIENIESDIGDVSALITQEYYTSADADEAIARKVEELEAEILTNDGQVRGSILSDYYTILDADQAMTRKIEEMESEYFTPDGRIRGSVMEDYYTISRADEAMAGKISDFRASIMNNQGQIRATALTEYYTSSDVDSEIEGRVGDAISTLRDTLTGQIQTIDDIAGSNQYQRILDATDQITSGSAASVTLGGAAFGREKTLIIGENSTDRATSGTTNGAYFALPEPIRANLMGRRVKVSVLAKKPQYSPASAFSVVYSTNAVGNSGAIASDPLTSDYKWHNFYWDVPTGGADGNDYVAIFGDNSKSNKRVQVSRVIVARSAEAEELPEINDLSADISNVLGLNVSPTQAFGNWVQNIGVSVPDPEYPGQTLSARTRLTASTVARIDGRLSSVVGFRAEAGNSVSLLSLVSARDPDGQSYSLAKLSADDIILDGTVGTEKLIVGLGRNLLPNADFSSGLTHWDDEWHYQGAGADSELKIRSAGSSWAGTTYNTLEIFQNSNDSVGLLRVACRVEDQDGNMGRGVDVEPNEWYELQVRASTHRCSGRLVAQFYAANGDLVGTNHGADFADNLSDSTNPNNWPRYWMKVKAPANAAFLSFKVDKYGTQSGSNSFMFLHHPQVARTGESAGQASAWSPGTTTMIDGGLVRANTLAGDRLIAGSVTAREAAFESLAALGLTVGNADIVGEIKSDNFLPNVRGWRIQPGGGAEFNGPIISRPLELKSGAFSPGGSASNGTKYLWVNTGIKIGKHDAWRTGRVALVADAAITTGAQGPSGLDPHNSFWSCRAEIMSGARWFGYNGNPQPNEIYRMDPPTTITPRWATGTDQRVFLRISVDAVGGIYFPNPRIEWKVFEVT